MKTMITLIKRNVKLFFKDKGMFFTSLVTPGILLVLYATFLSNVYRDSFMSGLPAGFSVSEGLVDGLVAGQLVSSILTVSCVTVAFCSNFLMVQDKANGRIKDFLISPVKSSTLSVSYYVATLISTLIVCLTATVICLGYLALTGWYLSATDVLLLFADVIVLVLFGTVLSSLINFFLSTQGQISAVGTIISAGYGFICGAYMPISSFTTGLQNVVKFLPGTYGTSLMRNHALNGVFDQMLSEGMPQMAVDQFKTLLDCNIEFFGTNVTEGAMYAILAGSVIILLGLFILANKLKNKN